MIKLFYIKELFQKGISALKQLAMRRVPLKNDALFDSAPISGEIKGLFLAQRIKLAYGVFIGKYYVIDAYTYKDGVYTKLD